jgi:hypothetical protein
MTLSIMAIVIMKLIHTVASKYQSLALSVYGECLVMIIFIMAHNESRS